MVKPAQEGGHLWLYSLKVHCCSPQGLRSCLMPTSFLKAKGSIPVESFNPCPPALAALLRFAPFLLHVCKHQIQMGPMRRALVRMALCWHTGGARAASWGNRRQTCSLLKIFSGLPWRPLSGVTSGCLLESITSSVIVSGYLRCEIT